MGFSYADLERYLTNGPDGVAPALAMRIERLVRTTEHKRAQASCRRRRIRFRCVLTGFCRVHTSVRSGFREVRSRLLNSRNLSAPCRTRAYPTPVAIAPERRCAVSGSPESRWSAAWTISRSAGSDDIGQLLQLAFEAVQVQRADGVDGARSQPASSLASSVAIACSAVSSGAPTSWLASRDALVDGDLAVEERQQQAPKSGLQHVVEELERVRAHGWIGRSHADIGIVKPRSGGRAAPSAGTSVRAPGPSTDGARPAPDRRP